METSEALLILCTAPDADLGSRLARGLVEAKLAACVNIIPGVRSFYVWQGALADDEEVQLFIKTRRSLYGLVEEWLTANHPYDEPEILAIDLAAGSEGYLRWVREQTEPC